MASSERPRPKKTKTGKASQDKPARAAKPVPKLKAKPKAAPSTKGAKRAAPKVQARPAVRRKLTAVPKVSAPAEAPAPRSARRKPAPASQKADAHFVSVVVPTIGRPSLEPSLAALNRQTRPADEIIVVVDEDRRGPAWALNEGIRRSKGDLVAFTPDDGEPAPEWLERLVAAIDRHDADCAGGYYQESDPLLDEVRNLWPMPDVEVIDTVGYIGNGGTILFKRSWLEDCIKRDGHVYNELFPVAEDWELMWRLRRRGMKVVFVPVKTLHLRRSAPLNHIQHQFNRGIGIALLYKLQRCAGPGTAMQRSLIWGQSDSPTGAKWASAFVQKIIGPFNRSHFSSARHFWTHWLAEKFQSVGFLWGIIAYKVTMPK